jgi:biotin-(acetyl-CoA carboxylase) ligase
MPHPLDGLVRDPAREQRLGRAYPGVSIYAYARVSSTMDVAHALAAEGAPEGALVFATEQEQGRGRLSRTWESPEGGAYCSLILRPTRPQAEMSQLSLVAGLAVAETVRELTHLSPSIRWPNDVLVKGHKLAGILVEAKNGAVIVGIGVNVSCAPADRPAAGPASCGTSSVGNPAVADTSSPAGIEPARSPARMVPARSQATSLAACGVSGLDPCEVAGGLCRSVRAWYDVWTAQGFGQIREALRPYIHMFGQMVRMTTDQRGADSVQRIGNMVEGQAVDIDEAGRLVVRLDSGLLRAFSMAEVTLLR